MQGLVASTSRPVVIKPGTITTGWPGFRPSLRSWAPTDVSGPRRSSRQLVTIASEKQETASSAAPAANPTFLVTRRAHRTPCSAPKVRLLLLEAITTHEGTRYCVQGPDKLLIGSQWLGPKGQLGLCLLELLNVSMRVAELDLSETAHKRYHYASNELLTRLWPPLP